MPPSLTITMPRPGVRPPLRKRRRPRLTRMMPTESWAPADGFERFAYTAGANVVTAIGFALILVAVSEAFGGIASWRQGLFWGFAGFAVFTLAPGLGLPPELPAMPTADLAARQVWWIGTVLATAAGLALIAFRSSIPLALLGVVLIVVPHIIGAPQPESHEIADTGGPAPSVCGGRDSDQPDFLGRAREHCRADPDALHVLRNRDAAPLCVRPAS